MTLKLQKLEDNESSTNSLLSRQRKPDKNAIKNCIEDESEYHAADLYKYQVLSSEVRNAIKDRTA